MPGKKQTPERKLTIIVGASRATDTKRGCSVGSNIEIGEYNEDEHAFNLDSQFTDFASGLIDLDALPEEMDHVRDLFDLLLKQFEKDYHSRSAFQCLFSMIITEAVSLAAQNQKILDTFQFVNTGSWPKRDKDNEEAS